MKTKKEKDIRNLRAEGIRNRMKYIHDAMEFRRRMQERKTKQKKLRQKGESKGNENEDESNEKGVEE